MVLRGIFNATAIWRADLPAAFGLRMRRTRSTAPQWSAVSVSRDSVAIALIGSSAGRTVQTALDKRRLHRGGHVQHHALLRSRAECGECGSPLWVQACQTEAVQRRRYICSAKLPASAGACKSPRQDIDAVDQAVWGASLRPWATGRS